MAASKMTKPDCYLLAAVALAEECPLARRLDFSDDGEFTVLVAGVYFDWLHGMNLTDIGPYWQFLFILVTRYLTVCV